MNLIILTLLLSLTSTWATGAKAAEGSFEELDHLLAQLRVTGGSASIDAKLALLKRAKSDRKAKAYIVEHLTGVLESYGGGEDASENGSWGNAAQLAGMLKVDAAIPILCKRIDVVTSSFGGLSAHYYFTNRDAMLALIEIGAPAVPGVIGVLTHGEPRQREEAAYVLSEIGTDAAWQALKARLPHEADSKVRERIDELLKHPPKGRP